MRDAPIRRPLTNFSNMQVYGWDNGGVEISCLLCGEIVAFGGCICCQDNQVLLSDLIQASRDHFCKESS
jgi:hypothetical protein